MATMLAVRRNTNLYGCHPPNTKSVRLADLVHSGKPPRQHKGQLSLKSWIVNVDIGCNFFVILNIQSVQIGKPFELMSSYSFDNSCRCANSSRDLFESLHLLLATILKLEPTKLDSLIFLSICFSRQKATLLQYFCLDKRQFCFKFVFHTKSFM